MALVVESTSFNSGNNLSSLAVTAPSGITTGDLLIHVVHSYQAPSGPPTGFTEIVSYDTIGSLVNRGDSHFLVSYKIAAPADESAGSYSVSWGGSLPDDGGAAVMLRVSGWTTGNPLYNSHTGTGAVGAVSLSRPNDQLLIMVMGGGTDDNTITPFNFTNFAITSSDSNPTWTRVCDLAYVAHGDVDPASKPFALAYATSTDTSTITGYSFDFTETTSDPIEMGHMLLNFVDELNESGTSALHSVDPTVNEANAVSGASGTSNLLSQVATFPSPSSVGTSPTQWQNETKPSTTWTNEEI